MTDNAISLIVSGMKKINTNNIQYLYMDDMRKWIGLRVNVCILFDCIWKVVWQILVLILSIVRNNRYQNFDIERTVK